MKCAVPLPCRDRLQSAFDGCELAQPKRRLPAPGIVAACGPLKMRWPQQGHLVNYSD